jgi:hypothetical protein
MRPREQATPPTTATAAAKPASGQTTDKAHPEARPDHDASAVAPKSVF